MNKLPQRRTSRGSSLIEVLVSILILSFGMLAMAGLHASAMRLGKMAQFRSVATQLSNDYADRMRANVAGAMAGNYNFVQAYTELTAVITAPACATATACTPLELAVADQAAWRNNARLSLPAGSLLVQQDPVTPNVVDVWVVWRDPQSNGPEGVGGECPAGIGAPVPLPSCMLFRVTL